MGQQPPSTVSNVRFLSEKEAAVYLTVSVSTMRRWRRASAGPEYFRVGDILRYSREGLDVFRTKNTFKAA